MFELKYCKSIPKSVAKNYPLLYGNRKITLYEGEKDSTTLITITEEDGEDVCLIDLKYDSFKLISGVPKFRVFINRFEIKETKRRLGHGSKVFQFLLEKLKDIYEITLNYVNYDDGASYKFWKSLGFKRIMKDSTMLIKKER